MLPIQRRGVNEEDDEVGRVDQRLRSCAEIAKMRQVHSFKENSWRCTVGNANANSKFANIEGWLDFLHALAWAKNALWACPCLSVYSVFPTGVGNQHDQVHCCATMTLDHISARMTKGETMISDHIRTTMTYVMWREVHLWNVSVLQRHFLHESKTPALKYSANIQTNDWLTPVTTSLTPWTRVLHLNLSLSS
jgi:hypothetical protein